MSSGFDNSFASLCQLTKKNKTWTVSLLLVLGKNLVLTDALKRKYEKLKMMILLRIFSTILLACGCVKPAIDLYISQEDVQNILGKLSFYFR